MEFFRRYLRQHRLAILLFILSWGLLAAGFALYGLPLAAVAYPALLSLLLCLAAAAWDYIRTLRRHRKLSELQTAANAQLMDRPDPASIGEADCMAAIAALPLEGAPDLQLSCSVGIALCPADGADYQRLYQCADLALYQAKSQGKACFAYYSQELKDGPGRSGRSRSAVSSPIDSDSVCDVTEQLARYAFRMLYDAGTTEAAINALDEHGFPAAVRACYNANKRRSRELSEVERPRSAGNS